jgi:flagellar hook-associated protein 1 FlgK
MSGLFGLLSITARALEAQTYGLNTVSQNVANVNTPGYSRRQVELMASAPTDALSAGNGVDILGVRAEHDTMLDQRLWQEQPLAQQQAALADSLGVVQVAIGTPGTSIDSSLQEFFDAFSTLTQDPVSSSNRQQVVRQGQALATAFNQMADRLTSAQQDADSRVQTDVDQVNALAGQIASLNTAIAQAGGGSTTSGQTLQDQQRELVGQLTQLLPTSVITRADGGLDLSVGSGQVLVAGSNTYELTTAPQAITGLLSIKASDGTDITPMVKSGHIGGLLSARDVNIPDYLSQLDDLAYAVVTQVNTKHAAGYDLSGNTGQNFFAALGSSTGAAAAIAVDPAVAGDATKVAAGTTAAPGDNEAAADIAALGTQNVMNGGTATFNDAWSSLIYAVGQDTQTAQNQQQTHTNVVQQIQNLQDSISGVSLDEEAMAMMKFQRAYQASAQMFGVVNTTLDTLLQMVR